MFYAKRGIALCVFFLFITNFRGYALAITPPYLDKAKIRLSIRPGESSYGDMVMENPNPQPRSIRVYLEDWYYRPSGDGSKKFVPANTTPLSCASWITFSPAQFTLPAFGRQRISYSVNVPQGAVGGHYAVLFFETIAGKEAPAQAGEVGVGLSLAIRVGVLFYVEPEGTIKRSAEIKNLVLNRDIYSGHLSVDADLYNTGNVDITASGTFNIIDKTGMVYARGEFNKVYTFATDEAKLMAVSKERIPKGKYDLILTIDLGKALEESDLGRGPVITKEAEIEVGEKGEILRVGGLR